jgi:hypothetical protein
VVVLHRLKPPVHAVFHYPLSTIHYKKGIILKSIGIIVLNWQGWPDTLACLDSLRKLTYPGPISLIVCDNASGDDSVAQILNWAQQHYATSEIGVLKTDLTTFEKLSNLTHTETDLTTFEKLSNLTHTETDLTTFEKLSNLTHTETDFNLTHTETDLTTFEKLSNLTHLPFILLQTNTNLGFAGGNNVGIRYALASQRFEYLWLLNNDTTVDSQALSVLCKCAAAQPQTALFGSTILEYYQRDRVQCAGGCHYFPLLTIFRQVLAGSPLNVALQHEEAIKLDYISGAAMFLRVATIQQIGLFNEEYFLFYEELDYTQRLKRQGYEIGWCKHSLVYHKGSASVGNVREGNREKLWKANYYENLSTLKYTANFHPKLLPLVMVLRFGLKSLALLSRGDFYLFQPLLKAYKDFIKGSG